MKSIQLSVFLNDTAFMNGAVIFKRTIEVNDNVQVDFHLINKALRILFGDRIVVSLNIFNK